MFTKSLSIAAAAALAFCGMAAQAATTNGFANGGFEMTTPTEAEPNTVSFASNWLSPQGNNLNLATLSTDAHTGSFSALLSRPDSPGAAKMQQDSVKQGLLADLTPGDTPILTFWYKGTAGFTGNALFSLRYLKPDGGALVIGQDTQFLNNNLVANEWTKFTFQGASVPVGATSAFVEFVTQVGPPLFNTVNAVLIDDVYLGVAAAVPEPETYALMLAGLVAVGAMVRRRRSA